MAVRPWHFPGLSSLLYCPSPSQCVSAAVHQDLGLASRANECSFRCLSPILLCPGGQGSWVWTHSKCPLPGSDHVQWPEAGYCLPTNSTLPISRWSRWPCLTLTLNLRSLTAPRSNKPGSGCWSGWSGGRQGREGSIYRLRGSRNLEFFKGPQANASLSTSIYCLLYSRQCSRSWGINQTGKVLTQPSQDCFLSFKFICLQISISIYSLLSPLCFFPSFSLPPPPRPFLLCLSSRYPPFGLLGLYPPWTPSFQSRWWLLFEGPCPTISCPKGPQDQVPTLVLDTGRTVTKALATLCTLVWLLPSVCAPVFDQV